MWQDQTCHGLSYVTESNKSRLVICDRIMSQPIMCDIIKHVTSCDNQTSRLVICDKQTCHGLSCDRFKHVTTCYMTIKHVMACYVSESNMSQLVKYNICIFKHLNKWSVFPVRAVQELLYIRDRATLLQDQWSAVLHCKRLIVRFHLW